MDTSPGKDDNLFIYILSLTAMMFGFIYENFAYILGITVVIFGIIVYVNMTKVTFDMPMTRSKKLIIETMEHKMGKNDINGDNDNSGDHNDDTNNNNNNVIIKNNLNNNNIASSKNNENTLLTPPIDLEKKLKSGFCNMHASKGSSATDIDNECKVFGKASCLNTDCCGWVVTADNPDGVCRAGNKNGITFNHDDTGKKIDVDCYYYNETKTGPSCL
jgi:hypothetical protein